MYLKSIELVGFKSFAQKTKLEFKPGMTAIVGPNGCGKSNVSDAVRWVLGEQRARALRGAKMEDVIFNGTDNAKPLGMAEVSITLADCASTLGVEYDEVCIARRVFRSGESGYFLNRKACRLKDIQRLFMDTGVGTDSYSVLEQGKIDQILSARPEDRRAVFEEASGITKFKADKKEALRKLEHTEANLLRLDDVIREVKRQIISLQRQAGKARRYKELSAEIRSLDIYASNQNLTDYEQTLATVAEQIGSLEQKSQQLHQQVEEAEQKAEHARQALSERENQINQALESASAARSQLQQANQLIAVNKDRVEELQTLTDRNDRETTEGKNRLAQHQQELVDLEANDPTLLAAVTESKQELDAALSVQKELEEKIHRCRQELSQKRTDSVELDSQLTKLQNELNALDARDRDAILKRERLATEKAELERSAKNFEERADSMQSTLSEQQAQIEQKRQQRETLVEAQTRMTAEKVEKQAQLAQLEQQMAAKTAQQELLAKQSSRQSGFPPGAQHLLDSEKTADWLEPGLLIGPLVELIQIDTQWQTALEVSLRNVMDTLVVKDADAARKLLEQLQNRSLGSVRLLHAGIASPAPLEPSSVGTALIDQITCDDSIRPLLQRLIGSVYLIDTLDPLPQPLPENHQFVTPDGLFISHTASEFTGSDEEDQSPLARHQLRIQLTDELEKLNSEQVALSTTLKNLDEMLGKESDPIQELTDGLMEARQGLATNQGEWQVILREKETLETRVKTVSFELEELEAQASSGSDSRASLAEQIQQKRTEQSQLRQTIQTHTEMLNKLEEERSQQFETSSEKRLLAAHAIQQQEQHQARKQPLQARVRELEELIQERASGMDSYRQRIEALRDQSNTAQEQLSGLQATVEQSEATLQQERAQRDQYLQTLTTAESGLRVQRQELEELQKQRSKLDIEKAETTMRKANLLERLTSAYQITPEELQEEELPTWEEDEVPSRESIETRVAEIQAKLDLMGPVNLVAIEEHAEHEERYAFLMKEQQDLLSAKQQLLEMIKTINNTTTELFEKTFNQVNAEFQEMFKQLFGGGSAKLVLTDEEDVLEAGIEIIARPPGKKLQSISLLSGGERTMTAVALLFSLFKVKPSPFCVMDELDAALDDANINRFVDALRGFLTQSQFVLITHSRQTIAAADVIYGVTMETRGISKLVSMQFADYEKKEKSLKSS